MGQPRKGLSGEGTLGQACNEVRDWIEPCDKKQKIRQVLTAIRAVMRLNRIAARELNEPGVCLHPNYKLKLGSNYSTASYQPHKLIGLNLPVPKCPDLSNGHNNGTHPIGLLLIPNTLVHVGCGVSAFTVYRINIMVQ